MQKIRQTISPQAFAKIHEELLRAELKGFAPTEAVAHALTCVGLGPSRWPPEPQEMVLVVDYGLTGAMYPFLQQDIVT